MLIGIHEIQNNMNRDLLKVYEEILDHNKIEYLRLDASRPGFWEKVGNVDLFIYRFGLFDSDKQRAHSIIPVLNLHMGIKCFPDWNTCWHFDDKIKEYYLLKQNGFPFVKTHIFWDRQSALNWLNSTKMPVVFKLRGGSGARNVILVRKKAHARRLIKKMFSRGVYSDQLIDKGTVRFKHFNARREIERLGGKILRYLRGEEVNRFWSIQKNYVLFQDFVPGNTYDTRVVVVGSKAYAFRRHNREGDFRASGSKNNDCDQSRIDTGLIEMAFKISEKLGFQSMAYDFIYNQGSPEIVEISYRYPDIPTFSTGYWNRDLKWTEGHFCPPYFHLMEMLGLQDLRQPELNKLTLY